MRAVQGASPPRSQSRVTVLVEDRLTEVMLTKLFLDPRLRFVVAGGKAAVKILLSHAEPFQGPSVFGIIDQDFEEHNQGDWADLDRKPTLRRFVLPVHEAENLLLDFPTLAALSDQTRPVTAADLEARARSHAELLIHWQACKAVLNELAAERGKDFPTAPPQPPSGVASLDDSLAHILSAAFWQREPEVLARWSESYIRQRLESRASDYRADVHSERWKATFCGKEVFRHLRACVKGLNRSGRDRLEEGWAEGLDDDFAHRLQEVTASDPDVDLAMRVAHHMREAGRIPGVLSELYSVLCSRSNLTLRPHRGSPAA